MAMKKDADVPGLYHTEVLLPANGGGAFHIIRDRDWGQAIYPSWDGADASADVWGPEEPMGHEWALYGNAGEVYRIELQRSRDLDNEEIRVSWNFLRTETLNNEIVEAAQRTQYFAAGSWD